MYEDIELGITPYDRQKEREEEQKNVEHHDEQLAHQEVSLWNIDDYPIEEPKNLRSVLEQIVYQEVILPYQVPGV